MTLYEYAKDIYYTTLRKAQLNDAAKLLISSTDFEDLINDDKKGLELIKAVVEFDVGMVRINLYRVSHILITWLLGIGLSDFFNLEEKEDDIGRLYYSQLWLQTAIIHDYGYFCRKELSNANLSIDEITFPYSLLTDSYSSERLSNLNGFSSLSDYKHYFTYSYDEISKYFQYAKSFHLDDIRKKMGDDIETIEPGTEINDHGIVGGCLAFNKYCQKVEKDKLGPSLAINWVQKIACFTAASHNVFKSGKAEYDPKYIQFGLTNLLSTSPRRISLDNKLLSLLSLVDTIECTKRFSATAGKEMEDKKTKEELSKKTPKYFIQSTTIKNVDISFIDKAIVLDFSNMREHIYSRKDFSTIERKDFLDRLDGHIRGIKGLSGWTSFAAYEGKSEDAVLVHL